jgi:RasGEF domain
MTSIGLSVVSRLTGMLLQIADWVNNAVLMKDDPRKRALIIKHFILTAEVCVLYSSFSESYV